ncbi:MAG TPA: pyridoxal-phosphate dependent enzyme, partial [Marmoricola sp.]|nr:pyridoxal-phosphate dependent enzyme [Marmoricola sp.]
MSTTAPHVSLADIREARRLLEGVSVPTAMEDSRWLSAVVGGPVLLKCENLQRTGSFKIRGAYVRMLRLTEEERARGVVAASAGNHAQGVALAAQLLGIKATVFMPEGAPIPKLNATIGYGAEVVFHGAYLDHSLEEALRFSAETGAVLIHPYDHEDIVAGQGTCGLEIMEQAPDVETVLIPLGGGGLVAGAATAIKEICREQGRPDVR